MLDILHTHVTTVCFIRKKINVGCSWIQKDVHILPCKYVKLELLIDDGFKRLNNY